MMDENKLKSAFSKVKIEMNVLGETVAKLQMQVAQSVRDSSNVSGVNGKEVKTKADIKLVDTVSSLNVELSSVKKLISTLSKLVEMNVSEIKEIKSEMADLRSDFNLDGVSESSNKENIELANSKLADFQDLINSKLTLEIAELKTEMSEEIAKVFDNMSTGLGKLEKKVNSKKVEKVTVKAVDILEEDEKLLDSNQKTLIEEVEFEEVEEKKPSRFKKAIKWLFVDEEETDNLESLKQDIKEDSKNKK